MCQLAAYLFQTEDVRAAALPALVESCLARPNNGALLAALVQLPALLARRDLPEARRLVAARAAQLEALRPPAFDWKQPTAVFPGNPQARAFWGGRGSRAFAGPGGGWGLGGAPPWLRARWIGPPPPLCGAHPDS